MKAVFSMSLASALLSLLAVLALSAITIVPRSGAASFRVFAMEVGFVVFFVWLGVAFWAMKRWRAETCHPAPVWLRCILLGGAAKGDTGQ